jgi:glycosyltransferase involved in cell wall biosynthesis
MTPPAWAMSAYPISEKYREDLRQWLGRPIEVVVLAEARRRGVLDTLRQLWNARTSQGFVLLQDASSEPIGPALRFLASLTRCGRLATVTADGRIVPFTRASGLLEAPRLVAGSLRGALATLICWTELRRLAARPPTYRPLRGDARVAFLKTNLWFGVKAGGSVGHVAGVASALARRCQHVDLFAVEEPPLVDAAVLFHRVDRASAFGYPFELNYYAYQRAFVSTALAVLAGHPPDFVYHRLSLANYSGLRLALETKVPVVLEYNGSEVWVSKHWGTPLTFPRLAALAEDVALRHADLVVAVSDVLGDELVARGVPPERVLVHPNCVDPARFDPGLYTADDRAQLLARYGLARDATVCGFIGTFGRWHGVTLLAEAIRELASARPEWLAAHRVHFLLIGDGLYMEQVRQTLSPPEVARFVTLTGLVEQERAPAFLAACDILLSPHVPNADGSRFFGSPTKLFEYMAMERAIVASDLDQIGEVLSPGMRIDQGQPDQAGSGADALAVLVTPGDRSDLIGGLTALVERPALRARLGQNARRRVLERYTWAHNVDELLTRLRELA